MKSKHTIRTHALKLKRNNNFKQITSDHIFNIEFLKLVIVSVGKIYFNTNDENSNFVSGSFVSFLAEHTHQYEFVGNVHTLLVFT